MRVSIRSENPGETKTRDSNYINYLSLLDVFVKIIRVKHVEMYKLYMRFRFKLRVIKY